MDYEEMIHELLHRSLVLLQANPTAVDHWQVQLLPEWTATDLPADASAGLVDFIREHKDYSFAYYDAFGKVCGKPREIAVYILTELIKDLVEEQLG